MATTLIKTYLNSLFSSSFQKPTMPIISSTQPSSSMVCIPRDIIIETLQRLPAKSLIRFKCVSKLWRDTIDSPQFAKMHLEYHERRKVHPEKLLLHTIDGTSVSLYTFEFYVLEHAPLLNDGIGKFTTLQTSPRKTGKNPSLYECSCDGMILWNYDDYIDEDNKLILWNPTIGKFRSISKPFNYLLNRPEIYGFGFDSIMQDYKIVRIAQSPYLYTYNFDVSLFTLMGNSWRTILICLPYKYKFGNQSAAITNGAVHFLAKKKINGVEEGVILAFNLSMEKIAEIQPPPCKFDENGLSLKVFGGKLFAHCKNGLWSMMDNSWTNIISYSCSSSVWRTLSMMPNGDILAAQDYTYNLFIFDKKKQKFREVKNSEWGGFNSIVDGHLMWSAVTYVESLISPNKFIM